MMYFERGLVSCFLRRGRANSEAGFTLVEILTVLVVLGILTAVTVPSYLGFRTRAGDGTAKANIRSALPAVEQFRVDNYGAKGDADERKQRPVTKG